MELGQLVAAIGLGAVVVEACGGDDDSDSVGTSSAAGFGLDWLDASASVTEVDRDAFDDSDYFAGDGALKTEQGPAR